MDEAATTRAAEPPGPSLPPPPAPPAANTTFGLRPIAVGALCVLIAAVAAVLAYRTLWPYPLQHARDLLAVLVVAAGVVGLAAAQVRTARRRTQAVSAAIIGAVAIPFIAVTVLPGVAQPRSQPIPGGPAHVLYAAPDGNWDVYLMPHGDAAGLIALTATEDVHERWPVLSPDGRTVAYTLIGPDGSMDLHLMQLGSDGQRASDEIVLPGRGRDVSASAWTPDGELLVQVAAPGQPSSIESLDIAGGELTPFLHNAVSMAYSPDGTQIAFTRRKRTEPRDLDIWVGRADGQQARDVIDAEGTQDFPTWSPDGSSLAYSGSSPWGDPDVFVARPDGTAVTDVTPASRDADTSQGWTPDGHILFLSNRSHTGGTFLYFMNGDGTDVRLALRL